MDTVHEAIAKRQTENMIPSVTYSNLHCCLWVLTFHFDSRSKFNLRQSIKRERFIFTAQKPYIISVVYEQKAFIKIYCICSRGKLFANKMISCALTTVCVALCPKNFESTLK